MSAVLRPTNRIWRWENRPRLKRSTAVVRARTDCGTCCECGRVATATGSEVATPTAPRAAVETGRRCHLDEPSQARSAAALRRVLLPAPASSGCFWARSDIAHTQTLSRPLALRSTVSVIYIIRYKMQGGSVAEWLVCWTQVQRARVQIAAVTLSGNSLRQTVHTQCVSVHREAKLVAALLRVAWVTAGLAESNGCLPPDL